VPPSSLDAPRLKDSQGSDLVLERLARLHPKVIDLTLDRMWRILAALGHPERQLPPVVHVAGTNGKGSLIAYLRAMLEAQGARVHVYTSPHLVRFHERIRLAGALIDEAALLTLLEECEAANGDTQITYFEITTAAALLAFARVPADVLLLEVGLGGRLDATNVIARPAVTAITPVSMDHMQFLGTTLAAIAREKAGILKPGVPCVVAPQEPAAADAIAARAAEVGAPLLRAGVEWHFSGTEEELTLDGRRYPPPRLAGAHQIENAATAVAVARALGQAVPALAMADEAIGEGLTKAAWPARMQRLTQGPLLDALPAGSALWLDGGHNQSAGAALGRHLAGWPPTHVVYGLMNTKAAPDFIAPIAARAASLRAVAIPGEPNSFTADEAAAAAPGAIACASLVEAVEGIAARSGGRPQHVLICGSLYLAGRVLRDHG